MSEKFNKFEEFLEQNFPSIDKHYENAMEYILNDMISVKDKQKKVRDIFNKFLIYFKEWKQL